MYRMIQRNIRNGICHASVRYARANNKLIKSLYDPTKPTSYLMEINWNNLYGWAMSQEMPDGKFEWVTVVECRAIKQQLNFADGRIAIFDLGLFDHRVLDEKKVSSSRWTWSTQQSCTSETTIICSPLR